MPDIQGFVGPGNTYTMYARLCGSWQHLHHVCKALWVLATLTPCMQVCTTDWGQLERAVVLDNVVTGSLRWGLQSEGCAGPIVLDLF